MKIIIFLSLVITLVSCKKDFKTESFSIRQSESQEISKSKKTDYYVDHIRTDDRHPLYISTVANTPSYLQVSTAPKSGLFKSLMATTSVGKDMMKINSRNDYAADYILKMKGKGSGLSLDELRRAGEVEYNEVMKNEGTIKYSFREKFDKLYENTEAATEERKRRLIEISDSIFTLIRNKVIQEENLGLESSAVIINNTSEVMESAIITILINFKFDNSTKTYFRSFQALNKDDIWPPNEKLNLNNSEILSYANNYDNKVFKFHEPKEIDFNIFITAKNSVGYNNNKFDKNIIMRLLGEFDNNGLNSKQMEKFGDRVYQQDISDIWSKEK